MPLRRLKIYLLSHLRTMQHNFFIPAALNQAAWENILSAYADSDIIPCPEVLDIKSA